MNLGTEGNHLLLSGSSNGVWGMNLANEKQWDRPAGLPGCLVFTQLFQGGTRRGVPHPRDRIPHGCAENWGSGRAWASSVQPHRLGQPPGNSPSLSRAVPEISVLSQGEPRSQGLPSVPTPGRGSRFYPPFLSVSANSCP